MVIELELGGHFRFSFVLSTRRNSGRLTRHEHEREHILGRLFGTYFGLHSSFVSFVPFILSQMNKKNDQYNSKENFNDGIRNP